MAVDLGRGDAGVPHDLGQQFDTATIQDKLARQGVPRGLVPRDLGEVAGGQGSVQVLGQGVRADERWSRAQVGPSTLRQTT